MHVLTSLMKEVTVRELDSQLEAFKEDEIRKTRNIYNLETLKNEPILRAYRDFFWEIRVDPTKNRPAAEALIRRILSGGQLPRINTLVDTYNLVSINTQVAIAAFDSNNIFGKLTMHYAKKDQEFLGIGMEKPLLFKGGEIVISDDDKMVAIYPYRDAEASKVTETTRNVLLLYCGVPGLCTERLQQAKGNACDLIARFCGGKLVREEDWNCPLGQKWKSQSERADQESF